MISTSRVFRLIKVFVMIVSFPALLKGQGETKPFTASGYLNSVQSAIFEDWDRDWSNDNILHNRLNLRLYAGNSLTFALEMRNRIFTGDMVRWDFDNSFASLTGEDRGWLDMSWNIFEERSFLLNTFIDRLWIDLSGTGYQLRVGRQRINWGQALVWNPNDLFNVYSYFDFDYPERPGSDAVRLQVYPTFSSAVELVAKLDNEERLTLAALYRFNTGGYDLQFIGGYTGEKDLVLGAGWSGAFGSTSFRGEYSWFRPSDNFADTSSVSLFTVGLDRSFGKGYGIQVQLLYSSAPLELDNLERLYIGEFSTKNQAFSRFSIFSSVTVPVTPLLNGSVSAILYPDIDGWFAGPSFEASLASNVSLSLFYQHFRASLSGEDIKMNLLFLRFGYSF